MDRNRTNFDRRDLTVYFCNSVEIPYIIIILIILMCLSNSLNYFSADGRKTILYDHGIVEDQQSKAEEADPLLVSLKLEKICFLVSEFVSEL